MKKKTIVALHDAVIDIKNALTRVAPDPQMIADHLALLQAASFFDRPIYIGDHPFKFHYQGFVETIATVVTKGSEGKLTRAIFRKSVEQCVRAFEPLTDKDEKEDTNVKFDRTLVSGFVNNLFYPEHESWPIANSMPGGFLVLAEREGGKTYYVTKVANCDVVVRVSEPTEHADNDPRAVGFADYRHALAAAVICSIVGLNTAIDSLRGMVFAVRGNATSGGYSSGIFEVATVVSNVFAEVGSNVILTLNPMTGGNVDQLRELSGRLEASVSGVLALHNRGQELSRHIRAMDGDRVSSQNVGKGPDSDPHVMGNMVAEAPVASSRMTQNMGHSVMIVPVSVDPESPLDSDLGHIARTNDYNEDPLVIRAHRRTLNLD